MGSRLWALWRFTAPMVLLQGQFLFPLAPRWLLTQTTSSLTVSLSSGARALDCPGSVVLKLRIAEWGWLATAPAEPALSGCSRWDAPCLSNLSCFYWLLPSALSYCGWLRPGSWATVLSEFTLRDMFLIKLSLFTSSLMVSKSTLSPFLCVPSINRQHVLFAILLDSSHLDWLLLPASPILPHI